MWIYRLVGQSELSVVEGPSDGGGNFAFRLPNGSYVFRFYPAVPGGCCSSDQRARSSSVTITVSGSDVSGVKGAVLP